MIFVSFSQIVAHLLACRARGNFATVVTPLLKLLRIYTGYYITLICGVPLTEGDKEFDIKVCVTLVRS